MISVIPDIYLTRFFTVCFLFRSSEVYRNQMFVLGSLRSKLTFLVFVPAFFEKHLLFVCFFSKPYSVCHTEINSSVCT